MTYGSKYHVGVMRKKVKTQEENISILDIKTYLLNESCFMEENETRVITKKKKKKDHAATLLRRAGLKMCS